MSTWNKKSFSVYTSEEKSALGLIKELGEQTNYNTDELEQLKINDSKKVSHQEMEDIYKIDKNANFIGSWHGIKKPTASQEGLQGTVDKIIDEDIPSIITQINNIKSETNLGCVLRPTTELNNPWQLFQDSAHESKGITSAIYNSDGTITLNFDKTYKKIISFNAFNDEMMKMYGLEVGASTSLSSAKLYLISKLIVGTTLTFTQSNQNITIGKGGHVESATWVSGTGVIVKFKNVPKQSPNSVQVTVSNALNLKTTCSITGEREITIKFYKANGDLSYSDFNLVVYVTPNGDKYVEPGYYTIQTYYAIGNNKQTKTKTFSVGAYSKTFAITRIEYISSTNDGKVHRNVGGTIRLHYSSPFVIDKNNMNVEVMDIANNVSNKFRKKGKYI